MLADENNDSSKKKTSRISITNTISNFLKNKEKKEERRRDSKRIVSLNHKTEGEKIMNDILRLRNDLKNKIYKNDDERSEDMHKLSSYETMYEKFWNNNNDDIKDLQVPSSHYDISKFSYDGYAVSRKCYKGGKNNSPKCKNISNILKKAFCCCKKRSKNNKTKK